MLRFLRDFALVIACLLLVVVGYHIAKAQFAPGIPTNLMTQTMANSWLASVEPNTTVTTDPTTGLWTVTFPTLSTSIPTVEAIPLNNGGTGVRPNCKVTTRSATTQTGYCWIDNPIATALGITLLGVPIPWTSGSVMVLAKEPTQ